MIMSDKEDILKERFQRWTGLIVQADTVVRVEEYERDGKIQRATAILLNDCAPGMYDFLLKNYYNDFREELAGALDNIYNRFDKLNFLAFYLAEVAKAGALFVKESPDKTHHLNFQFIPHNTAVTDQNPEFDENYFKDVYAIMQYSLRKMTVYLKTLQQNILAVSQQDITPPVSELRDEQPSNIEQPFAFFDRFFSRGGLTALRQKFVDESWAEGDLFDEKNDCRHAQIIMNGKDGSDGGDMEIGWQRVPFADRLREVLMEELNRSSQLVCSHLDRLKTNDEVELRLKLFLSSLGYYRELVRAYPLYRTYEICSTVIASLKGLILGKYNAFIPKEPLNDPGGRNRKEIQKKSVEESRESGQSTLSFEISGEKPLILIAKLYVLLTTEGFIPKDTDPTRFENAFNGSLIHEPLNIKWIAKSRNGQVNKKALLYLLSHMAEKKLVLENTTNAVFVKQVRMIFCDASGQSLENLDISNAMMNKFSEANKRDIETIIKRVQTDLS